MLPYDLDRWLSWRCHGYHRVDQSQPQEELNRLLGFIGYGSLEAPLWFLGREEGLGKRPDRPGWNLEWELHVRAAWDPVMDVRQAYMQLEDPYTDNLARTIMYE